MGISISGQYTVDSHATQDLGQIILPFLCNTSPAPASVFAVVILPGIERITRSATAPAPILLLIGSEPRRSLHPILEELGLPKAGFHAMRRFRTTWLRRQRAPEDLIRYCLEHANQSVTDGYSKPDEDAEFCREVAEKIGTGFDVPESMRPMRPKIWKKVVEAVPA